MASKSQKKMLIVKEAKRLGADHAKVISTKDVFVDERVRLKCIVPVCENFGRHLMCPPGLMSVEDFRKTLRTYRSAVLVQLESDADSLDKSNRRLDGRLALRLRKSGQTQAMEKRLHAIINYLEAFAFKHGFYLAAGLIGGECQLCDECVGQSTTVGCKHPFSARPSMQGLGIDVIRTAERAGLPVALSSVDKVRWTGLLLLE